MVECIFCGKECVNYCCSFCERMSRGAKFGRLLQYLGKCSESVSYLDEIRSAVERIEKVRDDLNLFGHRKCFF